MKKEILVGLFFLLTISTLAWGPETKKFICEESVIDLWGANATIDCLIEINRSSQLEIFGSDPVLRNYGSGFDIVINPALIPDLMFNDTENHHDYSDCPIVPGPDYTYLCGDRSENPSTENAQLWLSKAINSTTVCERIQKFCIAASYFSDSYFPPNRVEVKSINGCEKALSDSVDNKIIKVRGVWQIRDVCKFEYTRQLVGQNRTFKHRQTFVLTSDGINKIVSDLVEKGEAINDEPYLVTTTTSVVTTSTITKTTVETETTIPVERKKSRKGVFLLIVVLVIISVGYVGVKKGFR